MQTVNFFKSICGYETTVLDSFGIYDNPNNDEKAHLVFDDAVEWTMTVLNKTKKPIIFYPIDNCIEIFRENTAKKEKESTCDGMLLYENYLFFIEVSEGYNKSVQDCMNQIKSTILLFEKHHSDFNIDKKYAVVSNSARPNSTISYERCEEFREETGFGLSIKTVLKVK